MTRFGVYSAMAIVLFAAAPVVAADLKQISDSGFTVSYPEGMDAQAARIMQIVKTSYTPALAAHREMVSLLSDTDALATDIATWLGAEGTRHTAKERLDIYKMRSRTLIRCFTNIKLVKTGDAAAAGGLDAGVVRITYDPDTNDFKMSINAESTDQDAVDRTYLPVLVSADGKVRGEEKLGEMGVGFLGTSKGMVIASVVDRRLCHRPGFETLLPVRAMVQRGYERLDNAASCNRGPAPT